MLLTIISQLLLFSPSLSLASVSSHLSTSTNSTNSPSLNVSSCPGYTLHALHTSSTGFTASLSLAGAPCNAFGTDIANLTLAVSYESQSRLHVKIADVANQQFVVPESLIPRPGTSGEWTADSSDLVFHYDTSPFAFWITRRLSEEEQPLFDTRISSLPPTPISPVIPSDNSTALDGFPLVFEDTFLQLTSALPYDANVYGLGEVIASSGFRRNVVGENGTIQTNWARDIQDPVDQSMYYT